jgi:hypothetical protein
VAEVQSMRLKRRYLTLTADRARCLEFVSRSVSTIKLFLRPQHVTRIEHSVMKTYYGEGMGTYVDVHVKYLFEADWDFVNRS